MRKTIVILSVLAVFMMSFSLLEIISGGPDLPAIPYNYANIAFPSDVINNLSQMDNTPANNPITDDGATLGRVLFYDVELSKNRTVSCASCHIQKFGFSDTARFSRGFNGGLTPRNSMGLIHARFQRDSAFFWDNRAPSLEAQALIPIQNSVEMGLTLDTLVARISARSYYPQLFTNAFGSPVVTTDRISKAIAQFIRSMNSFGSKFRQGVEITNGNPESTPFSNFTAQENLGKSLFMDITRGNCQACHTRNVMVQQGAQNIGLDLVYADNGVGAASGRHAQDGKFSVPSLINVALTPPYMHDGRFKTLEEVIDFYSDSIKPHVNLSGFLREIIPGTVNPNNNTCDTCAPRHPHYSPTEKAALVAFLKTLTDTVLTTDVRWSNPFTCGTFTATTETACESFVWNGTAYTNSGTYVRNYTNANGCISADTLHLTVNRGTHNVSTIVACDTYVWNGTTYTSSGDYVRNYSNASGCPSADTLHLTINNSTHNKSIVNVCSAFAWNGNTYSNSGTYTYGYSNNNGCPSMDTLMLTIRQPTSSVTNLTICNTALPLNWNGVICSSAGSYSKTLINASGCDSVAMLNLSVNIGTPTTIPVVAQQLVDNTCGQRIYRYTCTSITNATGYAWTLPSGVGGIAGVFVDSGDISSSRVIRLKYSSNNAAITSDSIKVRGYSACGSTVTKGYKLINTLLSIPTAPSSLTITAISTNVCGQKIYRYSAPALPAATISNTAATGYKWTMPFGPVGATGVLDSGTLSSQVIKIRYSSNAAATLADSLRLQFTSACGLSLPKAARLSNTLLSPPAVPASITVSLVSDVCGARVYRYMAPLLPGATLTTGAATGYMWSMPIGLVGSTGVLDSGSLNSRIIRIRYSSNAAAVTGDTIKLAYTSDCGNSLPKALKLTNLVKSCPTTLTKISDLSKPDEIIPMDMIVYPNPSNSSFQLRVRPETIEGVSSQEKIEVRIIDAQGRRVDRFKVSPYQQRSFGSLLNPGLYYLEVIQGNRVKRLSLFKQ